MTKQDVQATIGLIIISAYFGAFVTVAWIVVHFIRKFW